MKNRAFHSGIWQSPYKAMFGVKFRTVVTSTNLLKEVVNKIGTDIFDEEDLEDFLNVGSTKDSAIFDVAVVFAELLIQHLIILYLVFIFVKFQIFATENEEPVNDSTEGGHDDV